MRMLSRSPSSPQRRSRAAIAPTISSRTRSASVSASPQLGSAGHARAQRSTGSSSSARRTPFARSTASIASRSAGANVAQDDVLRRHQDRVDAETVLTISRNALRSRTRSSSAIRPLGTGTPRYNLAVALLVPAEMVGHAEGRHLAARRQRLAEILGQTLARPVLAALGDDVFETRMAAVAAVAPIAVQPHDRGGGFEQIVGLDKRDRRRHPRIGRRLVVRHAVPAAEQEIVPREPLAGSNSATIARSLVNTSIVLSSGIASPILNLRGR